MTTNEPALTSIGIKSFWSKEGNGLSKCTPFSSLTNLLKRPSAKEKNILLNITIHIFLYRGWNAYETKYSRIKLNDLFLDNKMKFKHYVNEHKQVHKQNNLFYFLHCFSLNI